MEEEFYLTEEEKKSCQIFIDCIVEQYQKKDLDGEITKEKQKAEQIARFTVSTQSRGDGKI